MTTPYIDTDVIIRLLSGDDPDKQARATALFQQIEQQTLIVTAPDTVIADAVYVLSSSSLYNKPKAEVSELLTPLVQLPGFRVQNRRAVLAALRLYGTVSRLDFTDALVIGLMQLHGEQTVYSYDSDYDHVPGIARQEP